MILTTEYVVEIQPEQKKMTDKLRSLVFVFLFFWNIGGVVVITGKKYSKRFTEHVYIRCVVVAGGAVVTVVW